MLRSQPQFNDISNSCNTRKYKTQMGDSVVQTRTHLLTSDFGSSTRGERQFLKVFRNHTMLTTLQRLARLVVQSQFLTIMVGPQLLTIMVGPQLLIIMVGPQLLTIMVGPQLLTIMVGPQLLTIMVGPQLLTIMVGPQLHLSAIEADNPTVCLHGPKSSPNSVFQNLQILRTIASGHDAIHTPASFSIWGLL